MSFHTEVRFIDAKKNPATCEWCGQKIKTGDQAVSWSWFDGGMSYTSYEHRECHEAASLDSCMHGLEEHDPYPTWSHGRGELCTENTEENERQLFIAKLNARMELIIKRRNREARGLRNRGRHRPPSAG